MKSFWSHKLLCPNRDTKACAHWIQSQQLPFYWEWAMNHGIDDAPLQGDMQFLLPKRWKEEGMDAESKWETEKPETECVKLSGRAWSASASTTSLCELLPNHRTSAGREVCYPWIDWALLFLHASWWEHINCISWQIIMVCVWSFIEAVLGIKSSISDNFLLMKWFIFVYVNWGIT